MTCEQKYHEGSREVRRIKTFIRDGKMHEGCLQCIEPMLTDVYSTQKRLVTSKGTGKQYWISSAHIRDIKQRRCVPEGVARDGQIRFGVWKDKKGLGNNMRY